MTKTLPFLFAGLLAAVATAQTPEPPFKIGTWNLEFLGADDGHREMSPPAGERGPRTQLPPRTDADIAAIGRKVVELGVCVLAVQEVNDEATLQKVAAGAGPHWHSLLGTAGGWDDGKTAQRIGFLYDTRIVDLLFAEQLDDLPRKFEGVDIFHRVPVTACFRHKASGCDFRLVTVHLKAGQKAQDAQKRRGEATFLAQWLDSLRVEGEDGDVMLLGDFNCTHGTEPETIFERGKTMRYLEQSTPMPTIMHFPEPIDQVVVSNLFHEVRPQSLAVDNDCDGMARDAWRKTYSDHFPVTVEVDAHGDDDPHATFRQGPIAHRLPRQLERIATPTTTKPPVVVEPEVWPFRVGQQVRVLAQDGMYNGTLVAPIPTTEFGWVVLQTGDGTVAVPVHRITSILAR
jgi:endonuclease/exonuclease/phosphatase family metal-dependent hydrolase